MDVAEQVPDSIAIALGAVLAPIGYLSNVVTVRWMQGYPLYVDSFLSVRMGLFCLILAVTGGFVLWTMGRGLHWTPGVAAIGLAGWPWVYTAVPIGEPGYVAVPLVLTILVAGIESGVGNYSTASELWQDPLARAALAAGLIHLSGGIVLQMWARTTSYLIGFFPLILPLSFGLALTGGLAVLLWGHFRLRTPVVCTAGWFLWGSYGLWQMRGDLPWTQFSGIDWISLQPHPDYALQWTMLLVSILVLASVESAVRRLHQHSYRTITPE